MAGTSPGRRFASLLGAVGVGTVLGSSLLGVSWLLRPRTGASVGAATPLPAPTGPSVPTGPLAAVNPEEARAHMQEGDRARFAKKLALARRHYHRATKADPNCEPCALALIRVEEEIVEEINDAFLNGESHLAGGRFDDALRSFEYVRELDPAIDSPYFKHATTLVEQTKNAKAEWFAR